MTFSDLFRTIFRKPSHRRSNAKGSAGFGRQPRTGLSLLQLEDRLTPTGNFAITGVSLVDASGNPLSDITAGEKFYLSAAFSSESLPGGANVRFSFTVDGVTEYSSFLPTNAGASGPAAINSYPEGHFVATPGINLVSVTVDPDHSMPETTYADNTLSTTFDAAASTASVSYSVAQIRTAYGLNSIPNFGSALADGAGQTIAVVDQFNDPYILSDLNDFDEAMDATLTSTESLYQQFGAASSFATVYNQSGQNITAEIADSGVGGVPTVDPTGGWEGEETLDVEWAHAIAPGAKIDIIEVAAGTSLYVGDQIASTLPNVAVVSNSWSVVATSRDEGLDSAFATPAGHTGITYLASSGDFGANVYNKGQDANRYPSTSPNVVSVGATQLSTDNNAYASETGWSLPSLATASDYGSTDYSQSGRWTSHAGGFSGTYGTAAAGSSSAATWNLDASETGHGGGVAVAATWTADPSNATNATYDIYDGTQSSSTLLGAVTVDQTVAPVGTADGSSQFQELGVFFPSSGTVTVVLDASTANGRVVADAVGSAPDAASSGGASLFEAEPTYQFSVQDTGYRTTPDVAFDGAAGSGVTIYQTVPSDPSSSGLNFGHSGTSLSCPCWAGLIAIADQGRVAAGGASFNSPANPQQTLQALYSLPATDFNDVTSGYNGYEAGPGYDYVAGLGSPIANALIPDLVSYGLKPTITHIGSAAGPLTGGETVTLTGTHLIGTSAVAFGGVPATSFAVVSSTEITAVVPAHAAGAVSVSATTPGGTAASSAAAFAFVAPPSIASQSASAGSASGGNKVVLTGTALAGATLVEFGSNAATIVSDSATQLVAITPNGLAGAAAVSVVTAGGVATGSFTYVAVPTISAAAPSFGPLVGDTTVTLTGKNLAGATVAFGSRAGAIVSDAAGKIVVTSPVGAAGTVELTVTTAGGTAQEAYTYVGPPTVTGIGPKSGTLAGGTTVTITGTSLLGATGVTFGSTMGTIVSDSNTALVVTTPAGVLGKVAVAVVTGQGTSHATTAAAFTYVPAADPATSTVTLSGSTVVAGKGITVALQAKNASGTDLTTGGLAVTFALSDAGGASGTFGPVVDRGNGTYAATFTGTLVGTNAIAATIDGVAVTSGSPAFAVTPGPVSLAMSYVAASSLGVSVGGTLTVTLTAEDAYGNPEATGGQVVAFELIDPKGGTGKFGSVTDSGSGTYTATFTAATTGDVSITATIDGKTIGSIPIQIAIV